MTPSERERRIEAVTKVLYGHRVHCAGVSCASLAREALDAADEAVPVVPATWDGLLEHLDAMYPADVFSGESGDVGARLAVLARRLAEAEKGRRVMLERWSGMVEQSKQHVERARVRAERAEAAARDVAQQLRSEAHGRIQTIRGMCTDEEPYEGIDIALVALDGLIYSLAERLAPSFSGEEGTGG